MDPVKEALNDVLLLRSATKTCNELRKGLKAKLQTALLYANRDDLEWVTQVADQSNRKGRWPPNLVAWMRGRVGRPDFDSEDNADGNA